MQLTLIRHLPTEWNLKEKLQGKIDIPTLALNSEMREGVQENLRQLKKFPKPDIVLTSNLIRTKQTARIYGYEYQVEELLNELDFGKFEGKLKEFLFVECGENWLKNPKETILGGNIERLEKQIFNFIKKYQDYSHILIFGHGSWIRAIVSYTRYGTINHMNQFQLKNNELIHLKIN